VSAKAKAERRVKRVLHKANERSWYLNPLCRGRGDVTTDPKSVTCPRCIAALAKRKATGRKP